MDFNTLLWGALVLFMVVCCGMMMRMMMRRPPSDRSPRSVLRDETDRSGEPDEQKQSSSTTDHKEKHDV